MGKKIDSFILSTAAAAAFYFFYQKAFANRPLSILLAFISFIILQKTLRLLCGIFSRSACLKRRGIRKKAGGAIFTLAAMPEEEASSKIQRLISRCYGESSPLSLVQNHPSLLLSQQRIFDIWKRYRGRERLIICATCRADDAARNLAASLKAPRLAIVDADMLAQMIAEHPEDFKFSAGQSAAARLRLNHVRNLILNRKNAPRCIIMALCMLAIHLLSAKTAYLFAGFVLLFTGILSLKRPARPASLFR